MKLYTSRLAPNPRRVAIFLAEKDIDVPIEILGGDLQLDGITKNQSLGIDLRDRPGELANLTRILADQDANILDVSHHRVFTSTPAKGARTIFEIETRDREHLANVVTALSDRG